MSRIVDVRRHRIRAPALHRTLVHFKAAQSSPPAYTRRMLRAALAFAALSAACTGSGSGLGDERCNLGETETTIESASIEGRYLRLRVSYSGGCKEHEFALTWPGTFGPSDPPVTQVMLRHDGNGDACEAWVSRELFFDLSLMDATLVQNSVTSISLSIDQHPGALTYMPGQPDAPPNADVLPLERDCAAN